MARPRRRVLTWVIIAWIALTLIAAFGFAARDQACTSETGFELLSCRLEARVGFRAAIGWLVIGTIVLGILWIVTQPRPGVRECPACGSEVRRGLTQCSVCGHDFAAAASGGNLAPPPMPNHDIPPPPVPGRE